MCRHTKPDRRQIAEVFHVSVDLDDSLFSAELRVGEKSAIVTSFALVHKKVVDGINTYETYTRILQIQNGAHAIPMTLANSNI